MLQHFTPFPRITCFGCKKQMKKLIFKSFVEINWKCIIFTKKIKKSKIRALLTELERFFDPIFGPKNAQFWQIYELHRALKCGQNSKLSCDMSTKKHFLLGIYKKVTTFPRTPEHTLNHI